jgi:single-stranded-DNA-specific exonuclease
MLLSQITINRATKNRTRWAVVNPNRAKAYYPHGRLSGVGVAFKLAHATLRVAGVEADRGRAILGDLLDLVALGTVADIVSLRGENRVLARWGLDRLGRTRRSGLRALLELAGWARRRRLPIRSILSWRRG